MISWKLLWSGDWIIISTFDLLKNVKMCWSHDQKIGKYYWNFWSLEKNDFWSPDRSFDLLIILLISWKMWLLISWNSTSWPFPLFNTCCKLITERPMWFENYINTKKTQINIFLFTKKHAESFDTRHVSLNLMCCQQFFKEKVLYLLYSSSCKSCWDVDLVSTGS